VSGMEAKHPGPYGCQFAPTVDGAELQVLPWDARDAGDFNTDVPVMLGYNRDEGTIGIADLPGYKQGLDMTEAGFDLALNCSLNASMIKIAKRIYAVNQTGGNRETKDYTNYYWAATHVTGDYGFSCPTRRTARAISQFSKHDVFAYYFAHTPRAPPLSFAGIPGPYQNLTSGASHASEIEFVFQLTQKFCEQGECGQMLIGDDELLLSKTMAGYWINFAKFNDPNGKPHKGLSTPLTIPWPSFSIRAEDQSSIRFELPGLSIENGINNRQCDFIDSLGVTRTNDQYAWPTIQGQLRRT